MGFAIDFSGSDDYISVDDSLNVKGFTFIMFVYEMESNIYLLIRGKALRLPMFLAKFIRKLTKKHITIIRNI